MFNLRPGMPPLRPERYNAKARKSVAGGSSHKRKAPKITKNEETTDPNAEILELRPQEEKERNRREIMKQEVLIGSEILYCHSPSFSLAFTFEPNSFL